MSKSPQVRDGPGGPGAPPLRSESQSLFNIYYLGQTVVDRRCSSSVMPWIIEELKLNAAKMRFVWLTPGTEQVTYVADSGQELFSHTYGSILQCCLAVDGISFAYIARREKDNKYFCHVFQALTYEEATLIMNKFKRHAKEEVSVGSTISRGSNASFDSKKSSGLIFAQQTTTATAAAASNSSRGRGSGEDRALREYHLEYVGKFEVSSPATSKETQVETVDNIVAMVKENEKNGAILLPKAKPKRRSLSAMFKSIGKASSSSNRDSDSVDGIAASNSASSLLDDETFETNGQSTSSLSLHSQELEEGNSSTDISVTVTAASPDLLTPPMDVHRPMPQENSSSIGTTDGSASEREGKRESSSSPLVTEGLEERRENGVMEESKVAAVRNGSGSDVDAVGQNGEGLEEETTAAIRGLVRAVSDSTSSEFDTLPELANLKDTLAFQALSLTQHQKVKLVFSGLTVAMVSEQGEEQILNLNVRNISCCAQGSKEGEYVGFTSREGKGGKKYFCHLLLAQSRKQGSKVLESFRSSFAHALSVAMPAALCETCPLKQLHQLCRTLEGVSTQVAQTHLQECLSTLSEADYGRIMKQFKTSEHATQEFTQIVTLVGLLRQHFQRQQDNHTHRAFGAGGGLEDSSARLKLPALSRAKNALASSIDNLRSRQQNGQTTKKPGTKAGGEENRTAAAAATSDERVSQSLSLPVHSPIFARKTRLDTLMAPISMSPSPSQDGEKKLGGQVPVREVRERSWSASVKKHKIRELTVGGGGGGESPPSPRKEKDRSKERRTKGDRRTPPLPPASSATKTGKEPSAPRRTRAVSPLTSPPATTSSGQKKFEAFQTPRRAPVLGLSSRKGKRASRTPPAQMVSTPVDYPPGVRRGHRRSTSYTCRAEIFESINTPSERKTSHDLLEEFEIIEPSAIDQLGNSWLTTPDEEKEERKKKQEEQQQRRLEEERRSPRSKAKQRWKNAIKQQILLNKMDKNNKLVQQASSEADLKRLKLCYSDPHFQSVEAEATETWTKILTEQNQPQSVILKALIQGAPPKRRGEVWQFLSSQYQARSNVEYEFQPSLGTKEGFMQLCEERTQYEHNIYVDIGRTFPTHPYFSSSQKQGGQATLRRMLHAYAVADSETGYCQGISFVAGMILMHSKDELSAFKFLHMLMQLYSYRDVYASELTNLQLMLYQLSRLLYDLNPNLYYLLKENDVTPFYYAAPWFLTLFASQFPIAFCARVLDLFFYEGPTAVFKIALALLNLHEDYLMECHSMESTCVFLKNKLPDLVLNNMPIIFEEALRIDLGNRLATTEAEFEVMSELSENAFRSDIYVNDLESVNMVLRKQNSALIEQLAICHGSIRRLETMVTSLQEQLENQKQRMSKLEEKVATTHPRQSAAKEESRQTEPLPPPQQPLRVTADAQPS